MTILVWGAGAIGGTVGAYAVRAGHDVRFVDREEEHVAAINRGGLTVTGPVEAFTVPARATTPAALEGRYACVLLCVKAHHTEAATRMLEPHLADDGYVVSLQNGLNEEVIAEIVGRGRTVGAFVNFGADYLEPGVIHFGGRGTVVVGELDGASTPRVEALHRLLRAFEPTAALSDNVLGYLWGKLAYGAMLFATALTNASIADALANRAHRELFVALPREVVRVAEAAGVRPEAFDGFDPQAFAPDGDGAGAAASLDELVVFNRRSAKTHSGIWRDLAVRHRATEVDAQVGAVQRYGRRLGVPTPICDALAAQIHEIERGERALADANLDALMDAVPAAVRRGA